MEQTGSKSGKEYVRQSCILSPCLFNLYSEYIMQNAGLDETQAGIKITRRNINNFRYADDTTLMTDSEKELKSLFSSSSLSCHKGGVICISEIIDISPSNLDSGLCFIQSSISHDVLCIEVK